MSGSSSRMTIPSIDQPRARGAVSSHDDPRTAADTKPLDPRDGVLGD